MTPRLVLLSLVKHRRRGYFVCLCTSKFALTLALFSSPLVRSICSLISNGGTREQMLVFERESERVLVARARTEATCTYISTQTLRSSERERERERVSVGLSFRYILVRGEKFSLTL